MKRNVEHVQLNISNADRANVFQTIFCVMEQKVNIHRGSIQFRWNNVMIEFCIFRLSRLIGWNGRVLCFKMLPTIWISMRLRRLYRRWCTLRWQNRLFRWIRWELSVVWLSWKCKTAPIHYNNSINDPINNWSNISNNATTNSTE